MTGMRGRRRCETSPCWFAWPSQSRARARRNGDEREVQVADRTRASCLRVHVVEVVQRRRSVGVVAHAQRCAPRRRRLRSAAPPPRASIVSLFSSRRSSARASGATTFEKNVAWPAGPPSRRSMRRGFPSAGGAVAGDVGHSRIAAGTSPSANASKSPRGCATRAVAVHITRPAYREARCRRTPTRACPAGALIGGCARGAAARVLSLALREAEEIALHVLRAILARKVDRIGAVRRRPSRPEPRRPAHVDTL